MKKILFITFSLFFLVIHLSCSPKDNVTDDTLLYYKVGDSPKVNNSFIWLDKNNYSWLSITLPKRPYKKGNFLWYKYKIPNKKNINAVLTSGIHESVEVYCDKKLIYSFGNIDTKNYSFPGFRWFHLILLPEKMKDKHIYFRCYSTSSSLGFSSCKSGNMHNLIIEIIKNDMGRFLLGIFYLTISIIALLYALITSSRRPISDEKTNEGRLFYHFIFFTFAIAIAVIADTRIKELLFDFPQIWIYLRLAGLYFYMIGIIGFAMFIFDTPYHRMLPLLFYTLIIFSCSSIILSLLNFIHIMNTIQYFNILILAMTPIGLFVMVTSNLKKNKDTLIFITGALILIATAVRDSLVDLRILTREPFIQHWGTFAFVTCLGIIFIRRAMVLNGHYSNYLHDLVIAGDLVNSIIPETVKSPENLEISSLYIPMESIGGDFYDYFTINEDEIGLFICDVSGHGVPAALVSSMIKIIFDHQEHAALSPTLLLSNINQRLLERVERNFVTASYTVINSNEKKCLLGNAGHPPMIVLSKDENEIKSYRPKGRILGQFSKINAQSMEVTIKSGDRIILYTDGIIEVQGKRDIVFGDDQWNDFILKNRDSSHEVFFNKLKAELKDITNTSLFSDDVTIILIDVK